jgi:hypothetical protein
LSGLSDEGAYWFSLFWFWFWFFAVRKELCRSDYSFLALLLSLRPFVFIFHNRLGGLYADGSFSTQGVPTDQMSSAAAHAQT